MATQGAIQIEVTINNKSLTITKDHVISLRVQRVIGDAANSFTLEAFDETAWQLENALMGTKLAPIAVKYSSSNNLNQSMLFYGTCLNYQVTFAGRATMLSITGILSVSTGDSSGWWFNTNAIEWCGGIESRTLDDGTTVWYVDGKTMYKKDDADSYFEDWYENEDVCAIYDFKKDSNGNTLTKPTVYYNPSRIFKRIIRKYNGEIGPYNANIDMETGNPIDMPSSAADAPSWSLRDYGAGTFKLGDVDESRWIENLDCYQQQGETTAQYINRVLCKSAITGSVSVVDGVPTYDKAYEDETAGFQYYMKNGKHCFTKLNYGESLDQAEVVNITYGMQNSTVISFSMTQIGALAMTGGEEIDASSTSDLYGDTITADGRNTFGVEISDEKASENNKFINWYFGVVQAVKVSSSSSSTCLSANVSDVWDKLKKYTHSAELTVWADCSNRFVPGKYIDIIIMGAGGVKHYASGVYMIVSIDDNISGDGYTQTMKLVKNVDTTKNYTSSNSGETAQLTDSTGSKVSAITTVPEEQYVATDEERIAYLNTLKSTEDLRKEEVQAIIVEGYEKGWSPKYIEKKIEEINQKYS